MNKIFCIGQNKTGTTSLEQAFKDLNYNVYLQYKGGILLDDYINNKYDAIIDLCNSAQVFQDIPFSLPNTYKILDKEFPNSKFILSIRNNPEQWYNSLIKFHSLIMFNKNITNRKITLTDFKKNKYIYIKTLYINLYKIYIKQMMMIYIIKKY